jgi:hypothetical protein
LQEPTTQDDHTHGKRYKKRMKFKHKKFTTTRTKKKNGHPLIHHGKQAFM